MNEFPGTVVGMKKQIIRNDDLERLITYYFPPGTELLFPNEDIGCRIIRYEYRNVTPPWHTDAPFEFHILTVVLQNTATRNGGPCPEETRDANCLFNAFPMNKLDIVGEWNTRQLEDSVNQVLKNLEVKLEN